MADDPRQQQLQQELGDCVMNSSWFWCVAGVAAAIPLGVKKKSYWPVVYLGLAGTLLDLVSGYDKCKEQRLALERYLESKDAFGRQATSVEAQIAARRAAAAAAAERQGE